MERKLWTPKGDVNVGEAANNQGQPAPKSASAGATASPGSSTAPPGRTAETETGTPPEVDLKEVESYMAQLREVPAEQVIVSTAMSLFQVAVVHMRPEPEELAEAKLAIDAFGAIVETCGDRLSNAAELKQMLQEIRLHFVKLSNGSAESAAS